MSQLRHWSDFNAAKLLPNSVYLWACDESQPGDSRPSRSDAWVAWVILITQILCYIQLIVVPSTGLSDDPSGSSSVTGGSNSLVSVVAAMYLVTSIAATDLGADIALLSEARTVMATIECVQCMSIWRWVQRKMFGLVLLLSFLLLAAASIRVLFYSSFEDVDLVVGAAAVLFIADVDEKVMVVLKTIPSAWRLFCVLEVIGLSVTFALLGLRATDNGGEVSKGDHAGCTYGVAEELAGGCSIYSWLMILNYLPLSVTIVSLLLNAIVASPRRFMERHLLKNCSWQEWVFVSLLALWILEAVSGQFYFDAWALKTNNLVFLGLYAIGLVACVLFATYKRVFCRSSDRPTAMCISFRWTSSASIGLFYIPAGLFLAAIVVLVLAAETGLTGSDIDVLDPTWNPLIVTKAFCFLIFELWLMWGMLRKCNPAMGSLTGAMAVVVAEEHVPMAVSHEGCFRRLPPSINLLLGWVHIIALYTFTNLCLSDLISPYNERTGKVWAYIPLFVTYVCTLLWTGVCTAASNTKGVAFWAVAKYLLDSVVNCIWILRNAVMEGSIK